MKSDSRIASPVDSARSCRASVKINGVALGADVWCVVRWLEELDSVRGQQRTKMIRPVSANVVQHRIGRVSDDSHLLFDIEAVGGYPVDPRSVLPQQRGDANHIELVEIAVRNRRELHSLEDRV